MAIPKSSFTAVDKATNPQFYVDCMLNQHKTSFSEQYRAQALAALDLQSGQSVLDVGCGLGQDAANIAARVGPNGQVIGLDYSQTMIDKAITLHKDTTLPLSFRQGDVHALELKADQFDRCLAVKTFQHLPEPYQALTELVRVTKPGGRITIAEPDHDMRMIDSPHRELTRRFLQFRADTLRQGGIAHRLFALFQEAGLVSVQIFPVVGILTDLAECNRIYQFDRGMQAAVRYDVVTEAEADMWIETMEEAGKNGRFLSIATYLITTGEKPA